MWRWNSKALPGPFSSTVKAIAETTRWIFSKWRSIAGRRKYVSTPTFTVVRFKSKFKSNFDRHWFLNHRDYYFRQGCHVIAFACSSDSRIAQQVADRFLGSFLEWWYAWPVAASDGVSRDTCLVLRRLETHSYTSLSWLSLDAFMSCLGSSLVAPCLVLALSYDCLGVSTLSSMRTSLMTHTIWAIDAGQV